MGNGNEQKLPHGVKLLHDPVHNKGTAFTDAERDSLGLRGLLPPRICSAAEQEARVMGNLRSKATDLERYMFLVSLQDRNETLFYRVVVNHIEEIMPLIYTPTVGKACQQFSHIYRRPRGLYISLQERGRVRAPLSLSFPSSLIPPLPFSLFSPLHTPPLYLSPCFIFSLQS